jgi:hypothetical protein
MTRLVRLNEVQYVETDYDIERLVSEGFEVEELEKTNNTDEPPTDEPPTDDENQKGGKGKGKGSKKAEA